MSQSDYFEGCEAVKLNLNTMAKTITEEAGDKTKLSSHAHNFPLVGIGTSAGGLNAFKQMLAVIPVDSEMACVVVQHLNPTHDSKLTEILSRVTKIPIQEITDDVKILPNHSYVMPSGKLLTSINGVLKLTPRDRVKINLVIAIFFTSLALVWNSLVVDVVLSCAGSDGTPGLKMIKEPGGITIVQDESIEYGDMAQSNQVYQSFRDLCVFANRNFLKDPTFGKMDWINSRNVFYYMDTFLHKIALTNYHYASKENGVLLHGKSETASAVAELFISFDKHHKNFSRKPGTSRIMQVAARRREQTKREGKSSLTKKLIFA